MAFLDKLVENISLKSKEIVKMSKQNWSLFWSLFFCSPKDIKPLQTL